MNISETSVQLFGIKLAEPVTVVTDLLVSVICFYAYVQLRKAKNPSLVITLFTYYFLTMSISTAFGGIIGHGFLYALSFSWKIPAWIISMLSIALIERATIFHAKPFLKKQIGSFFAILNIVELVTMLVVVLATLNFFYVEVHAAYGLLVVVFSFELYMYRKKKSEESKLLLIAVAISALAALVHLTQFTIHLWFNYNDLAHILMGLAAYVFYLGARAMHSNEAEMSNC